VDGLLGEGGMGRVYLCSDLALGRQVAVKTLLPSLLTDPTMRERFTREARALARVRSPHVVTIHSIGDDGGVGPFVVMERLVGQDLLSWLRSNEQAPIADVIAVGRAAAIGLAHAHEAGVLHRDIKPANIFLKGREAGAGAVAIADVVITDFGLAKETASSVPQPGATPGVSAAQLTSADMVVGTPAYLAPELARGQPASPASDLYALGATLFHLLTGRPPFLGDVPLDVLTQAVLHPAPRARTLRPDTPPALDALLNRLLDKSPQMRPNTAAEVVSSLASLAEETTGSRPAPAKAPSPPSAPREDGSGTMVMGSLGTAESKAPAGPLSDGIDFAEPSSANEVPALVSTPRGTPVKTATYTVMMTDIAGYTERTGRQSREEASRWLALHDSLLQPIFRAFAGKVVKTIGDAFLVVFSSPTDAVHCGMAIQDRLFLHNDKATVDDRIHIRIALSAGEVRLRGIVGMGGDIFGEPVNLAARLEGLAEAGEVLLSDAVFATMNQAEVQTAPRGSHAFKGISRPVSVYVVVPSGGPGEPPFQQRTLGRVGHGPMEAIRDSARAVGPMLDGAAARGRDVWQRVQTRSGPMVRDVASRGQDAWQKLQARAPGGLRAVALPLGVGIAVVVVVGLLFSVVGGGRRGRINNGEASAVQAEIEAIADGKRTPGDLVDLGLAQIAQERRAQGLDTLLRAVSGGSDDGDILDASFASIAHKDGAGAVDIFAAWPKDIDGDLRDQLSSATWWPRHHALSGLEARKKATDDDRQVVALQDVTADDCGSRRFGLLLLKRSGKGDEAMAAIEKLGSVMASNLCMALDIKSAEDAVRRRSKN
jgi:serine/threonine protein kinase